MPPPHPAKEEPVPVSSDAPPKQQRRLKAKASAVRMPKYSGSGVILKTSYDDYTKDFRENEHVNKSFKEGYETKKIILEEKYKWRKINNQKKKKKNITSNSKSIIFSPPAPPLPPRRPRALGEESTATFSVLNVQEDECSLFTMRRSDDMQRGKQ